MPFFIAKSQGVRDNLEGDNSSASQFGGKINNFDLPSLALKRQQKKFVISLRQLKRQLQLFS